MSRRTSFCRSTQGCEMTTDHHSSVAVFPLIQCPVLTYRKRSLGALERWGCSTGLSLSETSCLTSDSAMLSCCQLLKYCSPYLKKRWNAENKAPFSGDFSGCQVDTALANTVCNVSATKATVSMDMSKRIFLLV